MILSYILTFTILIMSVIKVTDFFIKTDKSLNEKREEFIQETRRTHRRGSISLISAMLTVVITGLLLFFALKFKIELAEARYRKENYLCFQYLNLETKVYVTQMSTFNVLLSAAYVAMNSGYATAPAIVFFNGLKISRDIFHYKYLAIIMKFNKYCPNKLAALPYLAQFPYRLSGTQLSVNPLDATSIVRTNQWTINYYQPPPKNVRLKRTFILQAKMSISGPYIPNFQIRTREIPMGGFSSLSSHYGSL